MRQINTTGKMSMGVLDLTVGQVVRAQKPDLSAVVTNVS